MQIYLSIPGRSRFTRRLRGKSSSRSCPVHCARGRTAYIRLLAKELRISVITTKRAYEDLERDGFILTQQGRGSFVADQNPRPAARRTFKKSRGLPAGCGGCCTSGRYRL